VDDAYEPELLGVCGLFCGACPHHRATHPEGRHLLEQAARRGQDPAAYTCQGCRSDTLYVHPGCAHCELRACAEGRGLPHCGGCSELPCQRLATFRDDGRVHHREVVANLEDLNDRGVRRWLAEQRRRWTCACGLPFSWYETHCHGCGAPLASHGPDPTRPGG
jgi:hypothetical protein